MTSSAFAQTISWFPIILSVAVILFALSTMISWSYYGEQGMIYLGGKRTVIPYKVVFLLLAIVGSVFVETTKELGEKKDES